MTLSNRWISKRTHSKAATHSHTVWKCLPSPPKPLRSATPFAALSKLPTITLTQQTYRIIQLALRPRAGHSTIPSLCPCSSTAPPSYSSFFPCFFYYCIRTTPYKALPSRKLLSRSLTAPVANTRPPSSPAFSSPAPLPSSCSPPQPPTSSFVHRTVDAHPAITPASLNLLHSHIESSSQHNREGEKETYIPKQTNNTYSSYLPIT